MKTGIVGIILAGGTSRRMGGVDKSMLPLNSRPLVEWVADRLSLQVDQMALNANGDPKKFGGLGLDVIADPMPEPVGPLGGVLAGLQWSQRHCPHATHVVTAAVDTPFFPADLVDRLARAIPTPQTPALASCGGRLHPVFALWPVDLTDHLARHLKEGGVRRVQVYARDLLKSVVVDFPMEDGFDPFFNINTPADLALARERVLREKT